MSYRLPPLRKIPGKTVDGRTQLGQRSSHAGRDGDHVAAARRAAPPSNSPAIPGGIRTVATPIAISTVGDRSARAADATGTFAHGEVASTITGAKANPFAPASSAARRRAAQRQPNSCWAVGARNRRHRFAALIALGNDLRLLLRSPSSPPAGPGKHLRPLNRFRLGFGRKLSVRHVSNPLNAAGSTFAVHHTEMKVGLPELVYAIDLKYLTFETDP